MIGSYLADFGEVQKLAVTATATRRVREDIEQALRLRSPAQVWSDVARANLCLKVVKAEKVATHYTTLLQTVLNEAGSGIVYTQTRRLAREVHRMLVDAGIAAALYHAGLTAAARESAQIAFMSGSARVVVATNSFGLGIDKADIRFVHHASLPGSIEQYVQEIGRAGRDGLAAHCSLIYGSRDFYIQKFMIDKSFPEVTLLTQVLGATREYIAGGIGETLIALTRHLQAALGATAEDLRVTLEILCREGLLVRLTPRGGAGDYGEVMIGDGYCADEAAIIRDYPLRKEASMAKLEAMKFYAAASSEQRRQFLDEYFRR
jgi:ATP-dependent DNA helicase RecQ